MIAVPGSAVVSSRRPAQAFSPSDKWFSPLWEKMTKLNVVLSYLTWGRRATGRKTGATVLPDFCLSDL